MIAKNRTLMVFFAVIAVIIVAVPISFYELSSRPEPTISVVNDYSHYQWKANFYNHANETCPLFSAYVNSSAVINETGYPNTTILLSIHGYECYLATEGQVPWFGLIMNISGSLPSNLHPKTLVISQNLSAPGLNCWTQVTDNFYISSPTGKLSNLSLTHGKNYPDPCLPGFSENGSYKCILHFNNESSSSSHSTYNFSVRCMFIHGWFNFPKTNFTFYTNVGVEITGLSKLVILMDEFAVKDVDV
jgi:hypothetical protein